MLTSTHKKTHCDGPKSAEVDHQHQCVVCIDQQWDNYHLTVDQWRVAV